MEFRKIIRPGTIRPVTRRASVFCKIEHKAGRLSITGVVGPLPSGNALGSCGQILDELKRRDFEPAPAWTRAMVAELGRIWAAWHLNDMRPYSASMKAAGWPELAATPMLGYKFSRTRESYDAAKAAEAAALEALKAGRAFKPSADQTAAAALPLSYTQWERESDPEPAPLPGFERTRHIYGHNAGGIEPAERKTLGWLRPSEHPDGLLGRKLNADDPAGYGGQWWREDVPADLLQWLADLPDADKAPAWV